MQNTPLHSVFSSPAKEAADVPSGTPPRRIVLQTTGRTLSKSGRRAALRAPAPVPVIPARAAITVLALKHLGGEDGWILEAQSQRRSGSYVKLRRYVLKSLLWFLAHTGAVACGTRELRDYLAYLSLPCKEGRWGYAKLTEPVSVATARTYHTHLTLLFQWLTEEGALDVNPMQGVKPPRAAQEPIIPFTGAQFNALLAVAKLSAHPARDRAILLFLINTGVRSSELCGLCERDMDWTGPRPTALVLGKGNKHRMVSFSNETKNAIWMYRRQVLCGDIEPDTPLFVSERGSKSGQALTRSGLQQLIERLGRVAKLPDSVRASPHTFRHTFAYQFLRAGNDLKVLQAALGHTDIKMTARYLHMTDVDVRRQQSGFSPTAWTKNED